jgi:hypothetical protein
MVWQGNEVSEYDSVREMAHGAGEDMPEFVKRILRKITGK